MLKNYFSIVTGLASIPKILLNGTWKLNPGQMFPVTGTRIFKIAAGVFVVESAESNSRNFFVSKTLPNTLMSSKK